MHILEFIDYQVIPTEECFLIKPFRDLYNKDKSKNKEKFMQTLSVVYFYADPRSSYSYISNDEERLHAIVEQEGLPDNYTIDGIKDIIELYKKHTITSSYKLLQDTRIAADKVGYFLANVNLFEEDSKGKPKYTVNSITSAMKQVPEIVKQLQITEKLVAKEIEEEGRMRGGDRNKAIFEDGFDGV